MTENRSSDRDGKPVGKEKLEAAAARRRRAFLRRFGRFAAVTPPAIAIIMTAELVPTEALASGVGPPFEAPPETVPPPVGRGRGRGG